MRMERSLDRMALALHKDPRQQRLGKIDVQLEKMADEVESDLRGFRESSIDQFTAEIPKM